MGFGILLKTWHLGTLKAQAKGIWEGAEAGSPHHVEGALPASGGRHTLITRDGN